MRTKRRRDITKQSQVEAAQRKAARTLKDADVGAEMDGLDDDDGSADVILVDEDMLSSETKYADLLRTTHSLSVLSAGGAAPRSRLY